MVQITWASAQTHHFMLSVRPPPCIHRVELILAKVVRSLLQHGISHSLPVAVNGAQQRRQQNSRCNDIGAQGGHAALEVSETGCGTQQGIIMSRGNLCSLKHAAWPKLSWSV